MFLEPFDNNEPEQIAYQFGWTLRAIRSLAESNGNEFLNDFEFNLGSENYVGPVFFDALEKEKGVPLNDTKFLLVEFSPFLPWPQYEIACKRISESGYTPIIAHPERYLPVQEDKSRIEGLLKLGALLQVNASSIADPAGHASHKTAMELLSSGLAHVIASDGHSIDGRPLQMVPALVRLRKNFSQSQIERWVSTNPTEILSGRQPEAVYG